MQALHKGVRPLAICVTALDVFCWPICAQPPPGWRQRLACVWPRVLLLPCHAISEEGEPRKTQQKPRKTQHIHTSEQNPRPQSRDFRRDAISIDHSSKTPPDNTRTVSELPELATHVFRSSKQSIAQRARSTRVVSFPHVCSSSWQATRGLRAASKLGCQQQHSSRMPPSACFLCRMWL